MLIDTHAHLYWKEYEDDLNQVIQRAVNAGVNTVINVGVDIEKSKLALKQVQNELAKIPGFSAYSTIGIHPHEAQKYSSKQKESRIKLEEDIKRLEDIFKSSPEKVIAVGECGLDYKEVDEQTKQLQRQLFQAQIDLAKKLDLPLIVHCRDDRSQNSQNSEAWDEVLKMVDTHPAILHCYSGLSKTTNLVLSSSNLLVSFAGNITYPKNEYLKEAVRILPLEKIVLETDCPFLPPQSKRGQRNEPSALLDIVQLIVDIKDISFEKVANQTTANAKGVFRLREI